MASFLKVMDTIANTIMAYEQRMYQSMRVLKHVHPPIKNTDDNCLYCKIYGNVFCTGVVEMDTERLGVYVLPVSKSREN